MITACAPLPLSDRDTKWSCVSNPVSGGRAGGRKQINDSEERTEKVYQLEVTATVLYEEGNEFRKDRGAAYIRLVRYNSRADSHYLMTYWLNGEPIPNLNSYLRDGPHEFQNKIIDTRELLSCDEKDSEVIRRAIAKYDELIATPIPAATTTEQVVDEALF